MLFWMLAYHWLNNWNFNKRKFENLVNILTSMTWWRSVGKVSAPALPNGSWTQWNGTVRASEYDNSCQYGIRMCRNSMRPFDDMHHAFLLARFNQIESPKSHFSFSDHFHSYFWIIVIPSRWPIMSWMTTACQTNLVEFVGMTVEMSCDWHNGCWTTCFNFVSGVGL